MRDFFISALEKIVAVLVIVMVILVNSLALTTMFSSSIYDGGFFRGLFVLLMGGEFVLLAGGSMHLGPGIYQNTTKTVELLEKVQSQR